MTKRPDRDVALKELGARDLSLGDISLAYRQALAANPKDKERNLLVAVASRLGFSLVHARELVVLAREEKLL